MISLFPFQHAAATTIADRYRAFITDPERPAKRGYGKLPFYQSLQALTGAGKTVIIAEAVTQMRTVSTIEPIVLWVSKAKVVIEQTLANLQEGGKYHHLVDPFTALALRDCTHRHIEDITTGLILFATAATFNSKDRGTSDRRVFAIQQDIGGSSIWDALTRRHTTDGQKRPLIIFYDEGHNLSDQQTDLLLELKPEAFLVASATPRLPGKLAEVIELLKRNGFTDEQLYTGIRSTDVVEAELVKREVRLGGYITAEEAAIDAMIKDYRELTTITHDHGAGFSPKCIYVCDTNIPDDEQKPFSGRLAPPIRIWKCLVEQCKIDPREIAVYCDLNVSSTHPLPKEFTLFRGGENDYSKFVAGAYRHIIFNLSLQEGWDDPECYLGYIDKAMGSNIQVEQVIGRVLRQPSAKHYSDFRLNTCSFYIHVDAEGIFTEILREVQAKLSQDMPAVRITSTGGSSTVMVTYEPHTAMSLPNIGTHSDTASEKIAEIIARVSTYESESDTTSTGRYAYIRQEIGHTEPVAALEWQNHGAGMSVTVEWLLKRLIDRQYPAAYSSCDLDAPRFRRRIQIGSIAAQQLEYVANDIVETYLKYTDLAVMPGEAKKVGVASVDTTASEPFTHALHPAYSDLNPDELECARAIDRLGWTWYRNPENGGFRIPLLLLSKIRNFYPDFVIWTDTTIWLIDPKGAHLIRDAAGQKILSIDNTFGLPSVKVCLITQGKWESDFTVRPASRSTVTAWRLRSGRADQPQSFADVDELLKRIVGAKPRQ